MARIEAITTNGEVSTQLPQEGEAQPIAVGTAASTAMPASSRKVIRLDRVDDRDRGAPSDAHGSLHRRVLTVTSDAAPRRDPEGSHILSTGWSKPRRSRFLHPAR